MRRSLVSAGVAAVVVLAVTGATSPDDPPPPVIFSGVVIDAATDEAIADATVRVEGEDRLATTMRGGRFQLPIEVEGATVELVFDHDCYLTTRVEVPVSEDRSSVRVDVGLPWHYGRYGRDAPPLGGCELR